MSHRPGGRSRGHNRKTASSENSDLPGTRRLLAGLGWHPVDGRVAELAGNWRRQFLASHRLDVPDLCVAATAEVLGLPLMTSNIKHFPMFPGLAVPY